MNKNLEQAEVNLKAAKRTAREALRKVRGAELSRGWFKTRKGLLKTVSAMLFVLCSAQSVCAESKTFGMFVYDGRFWTAIRLFDSSQDCDVKAGRLYKTGQYQAVGCREMLHQDTAVCHHAPRQPPIAKRQALARD